MTAAPASEFNQEEAGGDWTIQKSYGMLKVGITLQGDATPSPWDPPPACVTLASLDQQVGCTRAGPPSPTAWYAHGLSVPWKTQWLANGSIECTTIPGLVWLVGGYCDPAPVSEEELREHFVLFHHVSSSDRERLVTGIHELGHVLNLHHCDYGAELPQHGQLGDQGRTHICEALKAGSPEAEGYRHVRPGEHGFPWCHMTAKHLSLHGAQSCCPDETQLKSKMEGTKLAVSPEKNQYCPGEPITVRVELTAVDQDIEYRSEDSLDPAYGYLSFWREAVEDRYDPLDNPVYLNADLPFVVLEKGKTAQRRGIQIWYGTGIDQSAPFDIMASYAGFHEPTATVVSPPVTVPISDDPAGRCNAAARRLFSHPEARRFAWLPGGDHLPGGRARLEAISDTHPTTVYAAYANLALTLHWARPFHYVTADRSLARRDPDPQRARVYRQRLRAQPGVLPDSYGGLVREGPLVP